MTGTLVNAGAVVVGSVIGAAAGRWVPERFRTRMMQTLGLGVLLVGLQMCLPSGRPLLAIGCLVGGAVMGEALGIEGRMERAGEEGRGSRAGAGV